MTNATAAIVAAVGSVWDEICRRNPDVPEVVIAIGAGAQPKGRLALGHFAADAWETLSDGDRHELFIGGEGLSRGAVDVLGTLLHEAAHGVAHTRGIKDTSRQGRYHNEKFRDVATELGLEISKVPVLGWSGTVVPAATAEAYRAQIGQLESAILVHRKHRQQPDEDDKGKKPDRAKHYCPDCLRVVRVGVQAAELGPVLCGVHEPPTEFLQGDPSEETN